MNGILLIDKPKDMTSRDVVNQASRLLKTKKIGHTGTLDPLATGVLILTVNQATKIAELITNYDKEYIAEVVLGLETDTLDITGGVLKQELTNISQAQIVKVMNKMVGEYNQEVPIYSAVKIKGKKLYEYARNKETIILPKRTVAIKELELISAVSYENNTTIFTIRCLVSKGTYIRSLIKDIASNLNTIGTMKNLRRTKQGIFKIEDCINISNIDYNKLISIKDCLADYHQVVIDEELFNKIKHGQIIDNIYETIPVVFIYQNKAIAIYQKYNEKQLKPWKMF